MTRIARLDKVIQRGRGKAAGVLGQTYDVYRITSGTNNAIVSGTPVISGLPARVAKAKKMAIENQAFDLLVFESTCDNRKLQIQDVLAQTGYENDNSVFIHAQARPTRESLWVRAEFNVSITRPMPAAGQAAQLPSSGMTFRTGDPASVLERDTEQVLTLSGGLFAFKASGTQASIPCGIQPLNRVRDGSSLGTPTDLYREHFLAYLPMLPGEQLNELDRICLPNSAGAPDRYEVAMIYTSEYTGLSGYVCICEKLGN